MAGSACLLSEISAKFLGTLVTSFLETRIRAPFKEKSWELSAWWAVSAPLRIVRGTGFYLVLWFSRQKISQFLKTLNVSFQGTRIPMNPKRSRSRLMVLMNVLKIPSHFRLPIPASFSCLECPFSMPIYPKTSFLYENESILDMIPDGLNWNVRNNVRLCGYVWRERMWNSRLILALGQACRNAAVCLCRYFVSFWFPRIFLKSFCLLGNSSQFFSTIFSIWFKNVDNNTLNTDSDPLIFGGESRLFQLARFFF